MLKLQSVEINRLYAQVLLIKGLKILKCRKTESLIHFLIWYLKTSVA